jgi:hypothetical protein
MNPLNELLDPSSYSFAVLELNYKDESDIHGLIRNELDLMLPHGIDGTAFFFQRIGHSKRFIVTLIKKPVPDTVLPKRTVFFFPLTINECDTCMKEYRTGDLEYKVEYEGGLLKSVIPCRH